jgi:general secretion pathway protein D
MSVTRNTTWTIAASALCACGLVLAQDDGGFESLLREISTPSPTAQAANAVGVVPPPAVAEPAPAEPVPAPVVVVEPEPAPVEPAPAPAAVDVVPAEPAPVEPVVEPAVMVEPAPVAVVEPAPVEVAEPAPAAVEVAPAVEAAPAAAAAAVTPEVGMEAQQAAKDYEIRMQAKEVAAKKGIADGLKQGETGDYDKSITDLKAALADLPDRPANRDLRNKASAALADAYYRKAKTLLDAGQNYNDAMGAARDAEKFGHRDAADLIKRIERAIQRKAIDDARPIPPGERDDFKKHTQSIADLLTEGRGLFRVEDYNAAESSFERVLLQDEYNVEAMRYLRRIEEIRYKVKTVERNATAAGMISQVRDSWNPPIREEVKFPGAGLERTTGKVVSEAEKLRKKMEAITFPLIDFRQANIVDVVKFLNEESVTLDKEENIGVNIILNLNIPGAGGGSGPAPTPMADPLMATPPADAGLGDLFGGGAFAPAPAAPVDVGAAPADGGSQGNTPTITLSLRRVSLLNALKYITEVASLKFRIDDNAVIITPEGVVQGRVVTRLYPVQPTFMDTVIERGADTADNNREGGEEFVSMETSRMTMNKPGAEAVRQFFVNAGVPFPAGTSISYNSAISQLIVANTPENLELFERILAQLNVVPQQVEIEARFVEIGQDDLEEFGFQWLLTDNFEIAQSTKGNAGIAGQQQVRMNADSEGVTKGLRFFELGTTGDISANSTSLAVNPIGDIATFASVLTNPELTVIVQALSQHGGSDLLSAPRVTTRSGVNAQIQVVREIIYPTEFETTSFQGTLNVSGDQGNAQVPPAVITPGSFETRQTGVILNVTPTVGPDGYTIDLTLVPEVTELVDWINYGTTFGEFQFFIPQPVFATRQITTSIVIWDGQTVVMGGLIREDMTRVSDKIPLLGDIPLIGRLFRTEGEYSRKKNLLIFVTARLVDPSGKTIRRGDTAAVAQPSVP